MTDAREQLGPAEQGWREYYDHNHRKLEDNPYDSWDYLTIEAKLRYVRKWAAQRQEDLRNEA